MQLILTLTADIRHNDHVSLPVTRPLIARDHY